METGAPGGKPSAWGPQKQHRSRISGTNWLVCWDAGRTSGLTGPCNRSSPISGYLKHPGFLGRHTSSAASKKMILNNVWLLESEGLTLLTSNHARRDKENRKNQDLGPAQELTRSRVIFSNQVFLRVWSFFCYQSSFFGHIIHDQVYQNEFWACKLLTVNYLYIHENYTSGGTHSTNRICVNCSC